MLIKISYTGRSSQRRQFRSQEDHHSTNSSEVRAGRLETLWRMISMQVFKQTKKNERAILRRISWWLGLTCSLVNLRRRGIRELLEERFRLAVAFPCSSHGGSLIRSSILLVTLFFSGQFSLVLRELILCSYMPVLYIKKAFLMTKSSLINQHSLCSAIWWLLDWLVVRLVRMTSGGCSALLVGAGSCGHHQFTIRNSHISSDATVGTVVVRGRECTIWNGPGLRRFS